MYILFLLQISFPVYFSPKLCRLEQLIFSSVAGELEQNWTKTRTTRA